MRPVAASFTLLVVTACASSPRMASTPARNSAGSIATTTTATTVAGGGAFVVRLGADTLAVERYTRTNARVEGDIVNRAPTVRVTHYTIDLDAAGRPTRVEYATRRPDGSLLPNGAKGVVLTFRNDSVASEIRTAADSLIRGAAAVALGTVPSIANSYALYEVGLMQIRTAKAPNGAITLWAPGAANASALKIAIAGDVATMDYFGDPITIRTDAAGHILAVDGSKSTNKAIVERVTTADIASLATAFGARGNMGQTSPRDTVRATLGATQLLIDYGRPSVRGRTVWGGLLVPYNAIWRTGANAATQLSTSTDLVIGGTTVPAGKYTLWTWPTEQGYQLVINKQTGQWGTEYKADQDLVRVPLAVTTLGVPVEQFTFAIDSSGNGGTLRMSWADRQLAVPFTVK